MTTTIHEDKLNLLADVCLSLRTPLPIEAMKPIPKGRGMIDIDGGEVVRRLNQAFGLCGYGWKYEGIVTWVDDFKAAKVWANKKSGGQESMLEDEPEEQPMTPGAIFEGKLWYRIPAGSGDWSEPIGMLGGVAAEKPYIKSDVMKGAFTNALTKAACQAFGIGWEVYANRIGIKPGAENNNAGTAIPMSPSKETMEKFIEYLDRHGLLQIVEKYKNAWGCDETTLRMISEVIRAMDSCIEGACTAAVAEATKQVSTG